MEGSLDRHIKPAQRETEWGGMTEQHPSAFAAAMGPLSWHLILI